MRRVISADPRRATRYRQRATKLLTNTARLSVKEVAMMSGFADPNYFAKVFRRFFGASPTEFRTTGMYASVPVEP